MNIAIYIFTEIRREYKCLLNAMKVQDSRASVGKSSSACAELSWKPVTMLPRQMPPESGYSCKGRGKSVVKTVSWMNFFPTSCSTRRDWRFYPDWWATMEERTGIAQVVMRHPWQPVIFYIMTKHAVKVDLGQLPSEVVWIVNKLTVLGLTFLLKFCCSFCRNSHVPILVGIFCHVL